MIKFQHYWLELPKLLRQLLWFLILWVVGVSAVSAIALLIKIPLGG